MTPVPLCPGGPAVGPIAYGLWRFADHDVPDAERLLGTALDRGMTLIDAADVYGYGGERGFGGAEALLGELFACDPALRGRMTLVTKGGVDLPTPYDASFDYMIAACDASLGRLRTDTVDLYLVHRPDMTAPPDETARALDLIVSSGRAARVGVSNYAPAQAAALAAHMDAPLAVQQVEVSAWAQDTMTDGTLDWGLANRAGAMAWSPLAGGALATGRPPQGADAEAFARVVGALDAIAAERGVTRTQAALAFVRGHASRPVPIIGTQEPVRIAEAAAAGELTLTRREWYSVVEARRGGPMP